MCSHPAMVADGTTLVPERVYPGISATRLADVHASAILISDGHDRDPRRSIRRSTHWSRSNGSELRRRELGAFLRSRRERLRPEQVGLRADRGGVAPPGFAARRSPSSPASASRGTRGSSRAATSTRPHRCSTPLARTLQFDSHEHTHLFTLAGLAATTIADQCLELSSDGAAADRPARAVPGRGHERPARPARLQPRLRELLPCDLESIPTEDRNVLWLAFTIPRGAKRSSIATMSSAAWSPSTAAQWPSTSTTPPGRRSSRGSIAPRPSSATVWARHDVDGVEGRTKRARHPTPGSCD